ncbi:MAG: flippase-like domain-containing protein, partial [Candidatus Aminicenantes bacterium]|nr:flippase-like domain-containing protein [Candidatus Aminicenantes bacterium]
MKFKLPRTRTKTLLGGVGLILFAYLILRIGVGVVLENVSRFGAWFAAIVFVGAVWLFFQACAWTIIQNAYFRKVPFFRLFRVRIISDALNILLPSASLGGEAARAYLIKGNVPLKEG